RLATTPGDTPLYVGKAEDSLVQRDLQTLFGDGRTGSSTVMRSFAALLRQSLSLAVRPRDPAKPGYLELRAVAGGRRQADPMDARLSGTGGVAVRCVAPAERDRGRGVTAMEPADQHQRSRSPMAIVPSSGSQCGWQT